MKITDSVRKAIDDWEQHELESAMLHACNAVDGTAKKFYPSIKGNNERFTRFLRCNYDVLSPMGAPGINLEKTRFPVNLPNAKASEGEPDIADIIYGIHRCSHGHGDELPDGFSLIEDTYGPNRITHMEVSKGKVRLSDRIIFGLLAAVVFSPINSDLVTNTLDGYFLRYGDCPPMLINEWWGRKNDFEAVIKMDPIPQVILDFKNMK